MRRIRKGTLHVELAAVAGLLTAALLAISGTPAAAADASAVAPSGQRVGPYTLAAAARASVPAFTDACADQLARLPFRAVCAVRQPDTVGRGVVFSGHADVTARASQYLFTVLADVTDGTPVLGTYPRTRAAAVAYWHQHAQLGGGAGTVTVDGERTVLGSSYLVGPLTLAPLPDGGTHDVALATFLRPLKIGTHHVRTDVSFTGTAVTSATGVAYVRFINDFTVTVPSEPAPL